MAFRLPRGGGGGGGGSVVAESNWTFRPRGVAEVADFAEGVALSSARRALPSTELRVVTPPCHTSAAAINAAPAAAASVSSSAPVNAAIAAAGDSARVTDFATAVVVAAVDSADVSAAIDSAAVAAAAIDSAAVAAAAAESVAIGAAAAAGGTRSGMSFKAHRRC